MEGRHARFVALAAAVVVLFAVIGANATSASRSPSATPRPPLTLTGDGGPTGGAVPTGATLVVTEAGVRFSFRVRRAGWGWFKGIPTRTSPRGPISINKSIVGPQGAEAILFWTSFPEGDYADPCARSLDQGNGSSAAALADAVATAPGTKLLSGPSNVTVGGHPAKQVVLKVRKSVGCDPGFFYSWREVFGGAFWRTTSVGDTMTVWIVSVGGKSVFIEAETRQGSSGLLREVKQIVESIRFD